jgi:segregation and condensation protein A
VVSERLSLRDRVRTLLLALSVARTIAFERLFEDDADRFEIILTFLALLELMKMGAVRAAQDERYGRILIEMIVADPSTVSIEAVDEYQSKVAVEEGTDDERGH